MCNSGNDYWSDLEEWYDEGKDDVNFIADDTQDVPSGTRNVPSQFNAEGVVAVHIWNQVPQCKPYM